MSAEQSGHPGLSIVTGGQREYVTFRLAGQLVGIPVLSVHDVLNAQNITKIPLAPESVAGVLNLRGRIVTAIDLRRHLGFPPRDDESEYMSIVVEYRDEPYSLQIDEVGDVLSLPADDMESNPVTLDDRLRVISDGVYRLDNDLMVILDVEKLLDHDMSTAA